MDEIFAKTPNEVWLEYENARLKSELAYYKGITAPRTLVGLIDVIGTLPSSLIPITTRHHNFTPELQGIAYTDFSDTRLHCIVRTMHEEMVDLTYHTTLDRSMIKNSSLYARAAADIHRRVLMDIGRRIANGTLWKEDYKEKQAVQVKRGEEEI